MDAVPARKTRVESAAQALASLSLEAPAGAFLGAEEDLLTRLGVSRPTLRQAAKMVENDRLISVRRGLRGGFYAARPDAADAILTLARYLRLRGATLFDVMRVSRPISEDAAELAAQSSDEGARLELAEFAASIEANDTPGALIRAETRLVNLVARLSGNPVIEVVMSIGYSFGLEERGVAIFQSPEQRAQIRALQSDVCRAILDGDADVARLMMRRRSSVIAEWLDRAASA